jgi:hypothetical protein
MAIFRTINYAERLFMPKMLAKISDDCDFPEAWAPGRPPKHPLFEVLFRNLTKVCEV